MQTSYEGLWFKEIKQILIEIFDSMSLSFLVVLYTFLQQSQNFHEIPTVLKIFQIFCI